MAERERRLARPYGGTFQPRVRVMDADDMARARLRMAGEILERNGGTESLVLIGLQTGGVELARSLAADVARLVDAERSAGRLADADAPEAGPSEVPVGTLDVVMHRDDVGIRPLLPEAPTSIPVDLNGTTVVLTDDVLFTGRTVRAALDALADWGRPRAVQLAVMVDRGHRELPIAPDYVGRVVPTRRVEMVDVAGDGVDLGELVK
ncbi:MAG: bifunctional pyr operon transcriptional regulator/uracil phosphoribosyltransferase PyrR [Microthrixaceae bacterium]|nr:bifunctional pyr operon transcriptional regulator/uracil phosphoribosyltransferase PyrR [Microthrixaceae bacterium]